MRHSLVCQVSPGDSDVFGVHSSDDGLEDKGPEEDSAAANASSTSKGLTLRKSLRRKLKKCGLPMINNASRKTNLTAESSNVLEVPALHKNDKYERLFLLDLSDRVKPISLFQDISHSIRRDGCTGRREESMGQSVGASTHHHPSGLQSISSRSHTKPSQGTDSRAKWRR